MFLATLALGSLITGGILWVTIRFADPSNDWNTPVATFGLAVLLTFVSMVPLYGWVGAIALLFFVLVKVYDLGIGQTLIVFIILVPANVGLRQLIIAYMAP